MQVRPKIAVGACSKYCPSYGLNGLKGDYAENIARKQRKSAANPGDPAFPAGGR
jgi:hypothetical protein